MTRVLLSATVLQGGRSGVASYIFGLLDGLAGIDAPIHVTVAGFADDARLFEPWAERIAWVTVPEPWRPAPRNVLWHQTRLRPLLARLRCDLLHIPSYRRIAWRPGVPQVVTIHDLAPFSLRGKYDPLRMFFGRHVARFLARRAGRVIAVSQTTARDVERFFGVHPPTLHVVWNGIDHSFFQPRPTGAAREALRSGHAQERPYFLYLARIEHPGKNHVRLIDAFERYAAETGDRETQLLLAGADWHGAEIVHARAAASPVAPQIRLPGFLPRESLPDWLSGAVAVVFPSLFEGFGFPPLEAMACGAPVISSTRGALGEIVGDAALLIDPERPEEIARAMVLLARDAASRDDLRRRGLERARLFDWRETARATARIYLEAGDARA